MDKVLTIALLTFKNFLPCRFFLFQTHMCTFMCRMTECIKLEGKTINFKLLYLSVSITFNYTELKHHNMRKVRRTHFCEAEAAHLGALYRL